ncbi:bifunctional hydroxymethylpyrimidine kinase/phosphomethylpyrimidine kinase [Porcipelethomonas sp.]|uniref:bifunctional hydroxymethylpyrimidine kinase/phosphomethylpyrimidine kinase n=1 Tax=Porcipelethomonas sp. TaxID=2981675 RepID=UPI003EF30369
MKTVLTIAGSDSIGGAGIQADIKTISACGCYAMSVITSVTAQNTMEVKGIHDIPPEFVVSQLEAVFDDIFPDAVKIGMLSNAEIICAIADFLKSKNARNIVADTVMVSTSGCRLLQEDAVSALVQKIFPVACVITPNVPEAEILSGISIKKPDDMLAAAKIISDKFNGSVLVKGGHLEDTAADLLYTDKGYEWFESRRIDNPNTHGTGCTLSSAIAANLAKGKGIKDSVSEAKDYVTGAIADGLNLGRGRGPLNHMYNPGGKNEL